MTQQLVKEYKRRCEKVTAFLASNRLMCAVVFDNETHRNSMLRYLTGHPQDAVLVVFNDATSHLASWDINLASAVACATEVLPLTDYTMDYMAAAACMIKKHESLDSYNTVLLPESLPFGDYKRLVSQLGTYEACENAKQLYAKFVQLRASKSPYEIDCIKKAARATDCTLKWLKENLAASSLTELDVELEIRKTARLENLEGVSFEPLVAGSERSFAIHAFPSSTQGEWGKDGLSLVDFGYKFEGYCSDVTFSVARHINNAQRTICDLVNEAYFTALKLYKPGGLITEAAAAVEQLFSRYGRKMPHSLGHGVGLDIHEEPRVKPRTSEDAPSIFEPGMIVTLEPGLYDVKEGGVRLENDILITQTGNEVLTNSSLYYL